MKKQVSIIWLIISAVLIILTGALLAYVYWQRSEMRNFKEQINIENEREKLEEEYTAIFQEYRQYENNRVWINNDSLIQKLDREKTRVQRLLEELRNRKNIDALTIDSLHEELQHLRNNIKIYQTTIDSLNRENRQLQAEKKRCAFALPKSYPRSKPITKRQSRTERESQFGRPARSGQHRNTHIEQTR